MEDLKIGLVCCWPAMRIYPVYSANLRRSLERLTGDKVPVITTDCACFEPEKALDEDYEYIDLRYINLYAKRGLLKDTVKNALYPSIEKRRGEAFAARTQGYDVADFQQSSYAFGYESLKAFVESGSKTKKIVTIHKLDTCQKEQPRLNRIYNRADGVIVFSKFTREGLIKDGVEPDKIAVIYHGTDLPQMADGVRDQAILFCGSPIPHIKGFEHFVGAMRMLRSEGIDLKVLVYGFFVAEEKDQAVEQSKAAGIDDLLSWTSFTSVDELVAEHQKSLVCLVPYTGYAGYFPSAYSMGNGVPVVATDILGHSEYLDGTGLLIPAGSAQALAEATKKVLGDEALRRELGAAGRKRAETTLSWDTVAGQTLAVFRAAVDGKPVASAGR